MGLTFIHATVRGPKNKEATLQFLVDSGAAYTVLPQKVWKRIGLKPKRSMSFTLADGTRVRRSVSECHLAFGKHEGHTPVVLGKRNDEALLGVLTLESFGLVLNPFDRTLRPMRALMV